MNTVDFANNRLLFYCVLLFYDHFINYLFLQYLSDLATTDVWQLAVFKFTKLEYDQLFGS